MKSSLHILYHFVIIILSAAITLSLPYTASYIAQKFLTFWSLIENEKLFLVFIEIVCAMLLIFIFNYLVRSWKDRKLASAAKRAGLSLVPPKNRLFPQKKFKTLKEKQGLSRDIIVIGSTGARTFVDPTGDLHEVIKNCREAKIMLLNPYSEGARIRASSIPEPDITTDHFKEQIKKSIAFLKGLNEILRNVKIKLYSDVPFLKLTILGEYIWVQHYHAGQDVQVMPEYVFKHNQNYSGFYSFFYQYYMNRWNDPGIPEYDFVTGELTYRDKTGNEIRREKFTLTCNEDLPSSTN